MRAVRVGAEQWPTDAGRDVELAEEDRAVVPGGKVAPGLEDAHPTAASTAAPISAERRIAAVLMSPSSTSGLVPSDLIPVRRERAGKTAVRDNLGPTG